MKRIPFGKEKKLEIIAITCPGCNVPREQYHEYGCVLESCPKCSGRILNCKCKTLGLGDGFRVIRAVANSITDRAEVGRAVDNGSKCLDITYYEDGVMIWIMRDSKGAGIMDELIQEISVGKSGDYYKISPEKVANLMDVSVDKASEILEELQAESLCPGWDQNNGPQQ